MKIQFPPPTTAAQPQMCLCLPDEKPKFLIFFCMLFSLWKNLLNNYGIQTFWMLQNIPNKKNIPDDVFLHK